MIGAQHDDAGTSVHASAADPVSTWYSLSQSAPDTSSAADPFDMPCIIGQCHRLVVPWPCRLW